MLDAKVVESIRSLSMEERDAFGLFLLSPYFHKGFSVAELTGFYHLVSSALANTATEPLTKEHAHAIVFPDKPFSEGRMDRLMFELNRLVKVFLLTQYYHRQENEVQRAVDYSEIHRKKGGGANFEKQLQKIKNDWLKSQKVSMETFFSQYLIVREEHEWQSTFNKVKDDLGIPEVIHFLDLFYFTTRLEFLNRFLLQQKAVAFEISDLAQWTLDATVSPEKYVQLYPILLIAEKIHELFRTEQPEPAGFQVLMELLNKHAAELSDTVLFQFYAYLRNYCTILIDAGNTEFVEILHDLHKDNLARGYFYHAGGIPPNAFLNIVQYALRIGKIDWANDLIESHRDIIIGDNETRDFYRMNVALSLFAQNKLEESLNMIPFGSTYSYYHLMARRLEIKIYYELGSDLLPSKIDAFKMFISRASNKSFSKHLTELFTNFGNFVYQLSLSLPGDKKRSEQLIQRIQSRKLVGERSWLLEKARELGESKK